LDLLPSLPTFCYASQDEAVVIVNQANAAQAALCETCWQNGAFHDLPAKHKVYLLEQAGRRRGGCNAFAQAVSAARMKAFNRSTKSSRKCAARYLQLTEFAAQA